MKYPDAGSLEDELIKGRKKILVVDDNPAVCTAVRAVLDRVGYVVTTAQDGREAIALISASDYDVIFLDVTMPKFDGLGVVDELRENNVGALAHTYLMTGGDADEFADLPVCGVIAKPLDINSLIAETKDCIGH